MPPHRFRQYRAFDVIMQTGSVSRAAEMMAVSQPAVSKLIQALEGELGIRLFDRANRRLIPTAEARRLHSEVESFLLSANRVDRLASQIRGSGVGELRIVALPMFGARFLPQVISDHRRSYGSRRVSLEVDVSRQVRKQILAGQADIGFAHPSGGDEQLAREMLPLIPGVALLPLDHPLTSRKVLTPSDFHGETFISMGRENRLRDIIDELFETHGVVREISIETNLFEGASSLVSGGLGITIVDAVTAAFSHPNVTMRPIAPTVSFPVEIIRPISAPPSQLINDFIAAVRGAVCACLDSMRSDGDEEFSKRKPSATNQPGTTG